MELYEYSVKKKGVNFSRRDLLGSYRSVDLILACLYMYPLRMSNQAPRSRWFKAIGRVLNLTHSHK